MADRRTLLRGLAALTASVIPVSAAPQALKVTPEPKRLATIEELAALDFTPLHVGKDFDILTREEWLALYDHYIVASNVAAKVLTDTKPEMLERVRRLMEEDDFSTLTALRSMLEDGEEILKTLQQPIAAAGTRLLCCACAVDVEEGGADA